MRREEARSKAEAGERRLLLIGGGEGDTALLEFIAATDEANLENQLAALSEAAGAAGWSRRCPSGCCVTTRRPCVTANTTTPT